MKDLKAYIKEGLFDEDVKKVSNVKNGIYS